MSVLSTRLLVSLALGASSCCVASVAADGDRQVVTWNRWPGHPRACALVPGELLEEAQATSNADAGVNLAGANAPSQRDALRAAEVRAYRLCEGYANGAISEEEYRNALLSADDATNPPGGTGAQ